ncbi:MAG: helix-turn-helix transcriptional regulator [Dermatophilaceae bacterium]
MEPPLPELSDRERSILDQLAAGAPIAQIARTLHLSEKSVRNYLTVIPRRLGVTDRTASIARTRSWTRPLTTPPAVLDDPPRQGA